MYNWHQLGRLINNYPHLCPRLDETSRAILTRGKWFHILFGLHPDGCIEERLEKKRQEHLSKNFSPIKHTPRFK